MHLPGFQGKKIAVLGFGLEGRAAAEFLLREGATVHIFDEKKEEEFLKAELELVRNMESKGVVFHWGKESVLQDFDLVFRSPGIPPGNLWLKAAKEAGTPVTSGTALFFEACPAVVVGVTGTKGKGTTASLLHKMLLSAGKKTELLGNIGVPALSALKGLSPDTVVVYELSSFQLMDVAKSPHIAIVLMVTQDHLDLHGSAIEYVEAKRNIVRYQGSEDVVIGNIDYAASRSITESSKGKKLWVSRRKPVAEGCFIDGSKVVLATEGRREEIIYTKDIRLPGPHNLENVCAAVMAAALLEIPVEHMQAVLRTFEGLAHRLHLVAEKSGVRYFDDSISTTPESAIAAIDSFTGPKILILGGSKKGADFTELATKIHKDPSIRAIIGMGEEWPRLKAAIEEAGGTAADIVQGLSSMEAVVRSAAAVACAGDVVLLSPACASFDMFKSYKDRGEQFVEAVRNLI